MSKDFLYFLVDENGLSYYLNNGLVQQSSTPKSLVNTPAEWDKLAIRWERNLVNYGVNRSFSGKLDFVGDGAKIMKYFMYNFNFEKKVYLLIHRQSLVTTEEHFAFVYKYLYKGELNFTKVIQKSVEDGYKVECEILEGGASKVLKSKQNTVYEIPCNSSNSEAIKVNLDGINFYEKLNFTFFDFACEDPKIHTIPLSFINGEGDSLGVYKGDQSYENVVNEGSYAADNNNYFLKAIIPIRIIIAGTLRLENIGSKNTTLTIAFYTSKGKVYALYVDGRLYPNTPVDISMNKTIDLEADESINLIHAWNYSTFDGKYPTVKVHETKFSIEFTSRFTKSTAYALPLMSVFSSLVKNMGDDQLKAKSNLLSAKKTLCLTSGNAIRGFSDAMIKTKLSDFYQAMQIILSAGMATKEKEIEIEPIATYFDTSNPISLGKISGLKVRPATDMLFNTIKVGYADNKNETVNGKQEYNTTQVYETVITRITKELNLICPYRADSYGIESIRINTQGKSSQDNKADNDVFLLCIEEVPVEGVYQLKRVTYTSITGLFSPETAFNIEELTPKRIILNNKSFLSSCLDGFDASSLKFLTTDKNSLLKTTLGGVTIEESANVLIQDLGNKIFKPVIFEFEAAPPDNLIELLEANPNRCFSFIPSEFGDQEFLGFNLSLSISPSTNETQSFTLLSGPDNDLKTLLNG
jgi:hypothetical protein